MSGKIITREFSIDDYDAALRIWERVKGIEIAEGDDRESVAQFLARNPGLSRVAADGSAIIGVALCGHDGRRGHIYHLAVDPAYQSRGLGQRLLDECLEGLRLTDRGTLFYNGQIPNESHVGRAPYRGGSALEMT